MNEMTRVRKKLRQSLGQELPDWIWRHRRVQNAAADYLNASSDTDREDCWSILEDEAGERLAAWNEGRKEGLRGLQSGTVGGSQDMREAERRDTGSSVQDLDTRALVGDRTRAMTRAMSALFALIGDQLPEVKAFRDRVLPGRVLDADEVRALIASPAARTFSPRWFEEWGIPFVGHRAEVLDTDPIGKRVDLWMTVRVDPPGVVKTVRYADLPEGDSNTRCVVQSGAVIPVYTPPLLESYLHRESHDEYDEYEYPHLWPGSVVDELYELSFELASAFDWPLAPYEAFDTLGLSRPRSETATWFVLTREAPPVRPIEARWELKYATRPMNTSPQRRIRLRIPPWLPEEEALQAFRLLRRERPKGLMLPKEARTLEVARFVYERERLDGPHEPPPWKALFERWNEENPGHRFTSPSNFRTTFLRGDAAVRGLNFQVPELIDADGKYVNPTTT